MSKRRCHLAPEGVCKYGGSRYKNYGFVQGSFDYCNHPRAKCILLLRKECPVKGFVWNQRQSEQPKEVSGDSTRNTGD